VPSVALSAQDTGGATLLALAGGTVYLPQHRLRTWVYLGGEGAMRQAVVDTGAPACILPQRVWSRLAVRGDITWATDSPAFFPTGAIAHTTVSGGQYPYRLGRVRLRFAYGSLAPRDVLVICTDDPAVAPPHLSLPPIIGLADVLNGRSLLLQVSADGQQWTATLSEP
jgi:hypothetical protein